MPNVIRKWLSIYPDQPVATLSAFFPVKPAPNRKHPSGCVQVGMACYITDIKRIWFLGLLPTTSACPTRLVGVADAVQDIADHLLTLRPFLD